MAQFARPDGDSENPGSWVTNTGSGTDIFTAIDEAIGNDGDFIESATNPVSTGYYEASLSDVLTPQVGTRTVRYRFAKNGGRQIDLTVQLRQGTTLLGSQGHTNISGSFTTGSFPVGSPISDYTNLQLRFIASTVGGGPGATARISWAEFEIPDAAATTPEVTTNIPLGLAVAGTTQVAHNASASVPLDLAVTAETAAEHSATANIPLDLAVEAIATTEHNVSASVPLDLALTATTQQPVQIPEVATSIPLSLVLAASSSVDHNVSANIPLDVEMASVDTSVDHNASTVIALDLSVAATTTAPPTAGAVSTSIPLSLVLASQTATEFQASVDIPFSLVLGAIAAVDHNASAAIPFTLGVDAATQAEHSVATGIALGFALAGTTFDPDLTVTPVVRATGVYQASTAAGRVAASIAAGTGRPSDVEGRQSQSRAVGSNASTAKAKGEV